MPSIRPPLRPAIRAPLRSPLAPALGGSQSLTAQVQALFAGGKVGGMWDMGDTATLFQDAAGATPVTAVTQPIGRVNDKSGLGNHATQPTAGSRPTYSARKNLLVKSEDFADAVWSSASSSLGAATVFSSGNVANLVLDTAANDQHTRIAEISTAAGAVTVSFKVRKKDLDYVVFRAVQDGIRCYFNVSSGTTGAISGAATTSISASGADFVCVVQFVTAGDMQLHFGVTPADATLVYVGSGVGNYIGEPQVETGSTATRYQRVNTASDYDTVGFPAFAQFDATDDALLFPAITFGGAFNTFVAGKVTGGTQGVHLWRTADVNGTWAKYKSGDATTPTGTGSGSPTYAINGTVLSPLQQGQLYTQINGVDCVVESIGVVLTAETALQFSGFAGSLFTGNSHRILMISGTLTAAEKLLCRRWAAEGNGATVV
jgi:hypothetical protein